MENITEEKKVRVKLPEEKYKGERYYLKHKEKILSKQKSKRKHQPYDSEYRKAYYQKNKEKIAELNRLNRLKNKPKKETKVETPNYIEDNELTYEIILSKGKGEATLKLKNMLYTICERINRRFSYNCEEIRYDILMESYIFVMNNWKGFDEYKYDKSLPYITEVIKRNKTYNFNKYRNGFMIGVTNEKLHFISHDSVYY